MQSKKKLTFDAICNDYPANEAKEQATRIVAKDVKAIVNELKVNRPILRLR